ncbi:hypothetical protein TNIN_307641 [Trichonephila inaurata madagascariensis]|uniref:Uncharacterized protein n=1 Tax=Trichonephila inaurata madagascariensis TaxID=2747483 RepID=A0A8X6JBN1_9ARAC|nr:hypothetical protein TNIN_307641 [Trichonephila inaurata madagascariensis]
MMDAPADGASPAIPGFVFQPPPSPPGVLFWEHPGEDRSAWGSGTGGMMQNPLLEGARQRNKIVSGSLLRCLSEIV